MMILTTKGSERILKHSTYLRALTLSLELIQKVYFGFYN